MRKWSLVRYGALGVVIDSAYSLTQSEVALSELVVGSVAQSAIRRKFGVSSARACWVLPGQRSCSDGFWWESELSTFINTSDAHSGCASGESA